MLLPLIAEARVILEATPGTAGTLPLVVRWLLDRLRKDATAREKLLDGVERVGNGYGTNKHVHGFRQ